MVQHSAKGFKKLPDGRIMSRGRRHQPEVKSPDMRQVAEDIIKLQFKRTDTINACMKRFYDVMRKHGIKQGTPSYNDEGKEMGRHCDNYEWTICKQLFISRVADTITWDMIMGAVPKDLEK